MLMESHDENLFPHGHRVESAGNVAHPVCAAPSFEETARQADVAFQQRDNAKINALIDKKSWGCMCCTELGLGLIISG